MPAIVGLGGHEVGLPARDTDGDRWYEPCIFSAHRFGVPEPDTSLGEC